MQTSVETTKKTEITVRLTGADIINLLLANHRASGVEVDGTLEKSQVYFKVPSGGDYSGMNLDINSDDAVEVILTYKK